MRARSWEKRMGEGCESGDESPSEPSWLGGLEARVSSVVIGGVYPTIAQMRQRWAIPVAARFWHMKNSA